MDHRAGNRNRKDIRASFRFEDVPVKGLIQYIDDLAVVHAPILKYRSFQAMFCTHRNNVAGAILSLPVPGFS